MIDGNKDQQYIKTLIKSLDEVNMLNFESELPDFKKSGPLLEHTRSRELGYEKYVMKLHEKAFHGIQSLFHLAKSLKTCFVPTPGVKVSVETLLNLL